MARAAPRSRPSWLIVAGLVVAVLVVGLLAAVFLRRDPVASSAPAAAVTTVKPDPAVQAKLDACHDRAQVMADVGGRLDRTFERHHQAHKDMMAGKIDQATRNRIWAETLAARAVLSPVFRSSVKSWTRACG